MGAEGGGLDDARLLRYSRHILLDDLGVNAQERLLASHALIVGVGGLGNPAALYLALAGVGRITLVDGDRVDLTNLQRQILFRDGDVASFKASTAKAALINRNADVAVEALDLRADQQTLKRLVACADVVLDCTDNFAARHAINAACVEHSKVLVSGAAIRFDAQLSVFDLRDPDAACYACLFPDSDQVDDQHCATMGVFSPLTGMVGAMQAGEAIKALTGAGALPSGRLLMIDALSSRIQSVEFGRDPACPVCAGRAR